MAEQLEIIRDLPFDFYGETYRAYLGADRNLYVRVSDICEAMGLAFAAQLRRIQNTYAISHKLIYIEVDTPYQEGTRRRAVAHMNIEGLTYWLATIDEKRVKPEIQERIRRFQRDFVDTVWMLYRSDIVSEVILAELDAYKSPVERELSEALDQVRGAINRIAAIEDRLARIEGFVSDTAIVNAQQQWQLQEMINAVAEALFESKKGKMPKTQCFAISHNDFKNTFRIPVYSMLPAERMEDAINYLAQRYKHFRPGVQLPQIFTDGTQQSLF
ncbi:MAG: phage antirepressor N-terminal domain-containing protein [Bacteroidota bacterium]